MTDAELMDAECIHGFVWYECPSCWFDSPLYRLCTDPDCPNAFAFRDPYPELPHWHYIGP